MMLTEKELMARWKVGRTTIWQMRTSGKLPFATMIGGQWRYPLKKVEEYEQSQQIQLNESNPTETTP